MEGCIIHYNYGSLVKGRQKLMRKPEFKKTTIHRPAILKWCKDLVSHFSGNKTATLIFSAADAPKYLLAPRCIPVFPIQVCIYTAFIHIGDLFWRYVLDFFQIYCYFLLILLLIAGRLFFLVILCRRSASRTPLSLHPNASAISDWYASGCSATYAFSFSGSIFRKLRCSSFFPKSPVSFSCFSHSRMVDMDTLNTRCVSSSVCPACLYSIVRVIVIFDELFGVKEAYVLPHDTIKPYARYSKHQNGYILIANGSVLTDADTKNITAQLR